LISGFRREVDKICAFVGYYAAYSGNFLPTFRDNLPLPPSKGQDEIYRLSPNVSKELPLHAAYYPRRAQISPI